MHEISLGAPRDIIPSSAPLLLQRDDEDFIDAVLADFSEESTRRGLAASRAKARDKKQALKLFQPVQRQFHLALMEAWCETPGRPRLDPARVDSAGMVVRRLVNVNGSSQWQGWMRGKGRLRGWLPVSQLGRDKVDPAGANRLASARTGVVDIDNALLALKAGSDEALLDEHVVPMFMAPPEVCQAARKTLFYGVVPTTSSELSEAPASFADADFNAASASFRDHLVEGLRGQAMSFALAGDSLHPAWFEAIEMPGASKPAGLSDAQWNTLRGNANMKRFVLLLRQLAIEFDAFTPINGAASSVEALLAQIRLPLLQRQPNDPPRTVAANIFLKQAIAVILERDPAAVRPEMPVSWPALSSSQSSQLSQALFGALEKRFAAMKSKAGRFEEPGARYAVRVFVRLKAESGCPPKTLWSDYSEPFVIAPWYEGSGAAPVQIPLPDVTDRNLLKSLKPNVAFTLPPALQNLLGGSPKDMLEGKGSTGGLQLGWICSFSIPIITICAFIVLNIFLTLFDLIFSWMFYIKVCIPFPKKGE